MYTFDSNATGIDTDHTRQVVTAVMYGMKKKWTLNGSSSGVGGMACLSCTEFTSCELMMAQSNTVHKILEVGARKWTAAGLVFVRPGCCHLV